MSDQRRMDPVDRQAAELFVQRIGAWVVTDARSIRENKVSDATANACVAAEAFMKVAAGRRPKRTTG